jgi:two-component system chemotaxis response regulator CheY
MSGKRILSIGQCGADHAALARTFQREFGASIVPADSAAEALDALQQQPFDLVLVNRILDVDGASGMDIIRQIKAASPTPVMLVSNHEDAQREAQQVGAAPGFGKAALGQPHMLARVRSLLGDY